MLTALILAKDEEESIEEAIKSVAFADEIVVIDDMSSDRTVEIAEKAGAKVIRHESSDNFAAQRNFAMEKAQGDWLFFIDADEKATQELAEEIQKITKDPAEYDAYRIKRKDFFWGKEVKHGEVSVTANKGIVRLIKKRSGTWKGKVHEVFETNAPAGLLNSYIYHHPHQTIQKFLDHVNRYSTLRADELHSQGKTTSALEIMIVPIGKFIDSFWLRGGYKNKAEGFVYSFMMSFYSFLVRAKLFLKART